MKAWAAARSIAAMACGLWAALAWATTGGLRFETLATEKGLSENSVKAIAEDRDGFVWIGTENGLNRFDGLEFTVLRAGDDSKALAEDHVNALLFTRDGALWIGTFGGGLARYDPRTGVFANHLHDPGDARSLGGNDVAALLEDVQGRLWVGTRGGGVQRLDGDRFTRIALPGGAGSDQVVALADDGAGGAWVGTLGAGLFRVDAHDRAQPVALAHGVTGEVTALLRDVDGVLWVGTRRDGLLRLAADATWQQWRHDDGEPASLAHDTINRLYRDAEHRLWIATAKGLDRFDPGAGGFVHHQHDPGDPTSLPYNDVFAVHEDALGDLWVGTGGGGVARYRPPGRQFALLEHDREDPRGPAVGGVWSVLEASDGRVWIGTLDGGLQVADPGSQRFHSYRNARDVYHPLTDSDVRGLAEEDRRTLWVGTRHGLNRLDRAHGRVRRFLHDPADPDSLGHDFVRPLVVDATGTLWIGTYGGGLDRYDAARDVFVHHRHDPADPASLSDDRVYSLLAARDGTLWVGTHGGGLDRLDPRTGKFQRWRHDPRAPHSLANDRVLALQQDAAGNVWIGTGSGLDRFAPKSGRFVHVEALRGDIVYGIAPDVDDALWLSTTDGLVKLDRDRRVAHRFPMRELWGNSEFNGGAWHRGRSGKLYFGGVSGAVVVDPSVRPEQPLPAPPLLTEFLLFNRPVAPATLQPGSPLPRPVAVADRIVLSHEDGVFGFAFAAPRATYPERRLYEYRLDGFDDRWIQTRAQRRDATYTAVPAGDYVFRVRVSDPEGVWQPQEAQVALTMTPAPWRSPLAYAAYALAALALAGWGLWRRHLRLEARARAQEALRQSEERLSLALWGSGDELLDWDLEAGTMHRIGGGEGRTGQGTGGLNDIDSLGILIHPDDFAGVRTALLAHFRGETEHLEVVFRERTKARDWPWKLVRARVSARDAHGRPRRFAGMQQDITRLKRVEAELRELNEALDTRVQERTAELEARRAELEAMLEELQRTQGELVESEKMASLGRLVAGVAHEVNTPLGVGVTAVSFLRTQLAQLATALHRYLPAAEADRLVAPIGQAAEMTENNLQRAATLVRTFKQVAVDQANPQLRTIVLRETLEATLQSLRPRLKPAGHRIELECDPELKVTARPDALVQVVVNLVMNSLLHAWPEGVAGTISIATAAVEGGQVRLVYRDDGAGMPPEVAARVFEPFYTTRRGSGGTGLGMHIVWNLVTQALGGKIALATAPGEGVVFTITIPQTPAIPQTPRE